MRTIFFHLMRHWRSRGAQYGLASRLLCIARSLRVFGWYGDHRALCQLRVVREHVAGSASDDLFHHLSHRDYLVRGWPASARVRAALSHYRFDDAMFDDAYARAVYGQRRLPLWRHEADGRQFTIQLEMASRSNAEGDLTIALVADDKCLHRLSFSWVDGELVGVDTPVVPFITRNQGRWIDSGAAFDAFERVFPNNSPSFFCFAAMQGIAQAVGIDRIVAIRSERHPAYVPSPEAHFANAYDGFWKILGGVEMGARDPGYLIALPFYVKPLADMPSKHRKRAAQRREHWRLIGDAARATLQRHLVRAPGAAPATAAPAAPAPAFTDAAVAVPASAMANASDPAS